MFTAEGTKTPKDSPNFVAFVVNKQDHP
jgi:hypothetical protein